METKDSLEQFTAYLQSINRHLRSKVFDQRSDAITRVQWLLLRHLTRSGSATIGQLAVHLDVRPSTMSQMIDRLEKSGLVRRGSDTGDARVKLVTLTEEGRDLIRRTESQWVEALSEPFDRFSEEERAQFLNYMRKLSEALPKNK